MSDETVEVTVKLLKLEGYEFTGEYRQPQKGEWYLGGEDTPIQASSAAPHVYLKCLILRRVVNGVRRQKEVSDDTKDWRLLTQHGASFGHRVVDAARKALALASVDLHEDFHGHPAQAACGAVVTCRGSGCVQPYLEHDLEDNVTKCTLLKGHKGSHKP